MRADMSDLKTADFVDVERYTRKWFEIAKFPRRFEDGMVGITATYSLLPNRKLRVLNSGYVGDFKGKLKTAKREACIVDNKTNAKLKVSFFWPFAGNYWIIELGKDYRYDVVGEGSRKYLWIFSRIPMMDEREYDGIVKRLEQNGFDVSRIELTLKQGGQ